MSLETQIAAVQQYLINMNETLKQVEKGLNKLADTLERQNEETIQQAQGILDAMLTPVPYQDAEDATT